MIQGACATQLSSPQPLPRKQEFAFRKEQIGSLKLPIVARDDDRDFAIAIENQLGETDDSHLGQLLTDAAGCDATGGHLKCRQVHSQRIYVHG